MPSNSIVMKFGGSSMNEECMGQNVAPIIRSTLEQNQHPIVVVSAMKGITDQLLFAAKQALQGAEQARMEMIEQIRRRHLDTIKATISQPEIRDETDRRVDGNIEEFERITKGIGLIGEMSAAAKNKVLATGESLSAQVLSSILKDSGMDAEFVDLKDLVPQTLSPDRPDYFTEVQSMIRDRISHLLEQEKIPVMTGYFGQVLNSERNRGILEYVGRGYSDFCASLVAAAFKDTVHKYQNWTDVNGIYSADPRTVPEAETIPHASYREIAEVAGNGGKVLHPRTMTPAQRTGIPIEVKNTFNPDAPGTLITNENHDTDAPFKIITCKTGATRIDIETPEMLDQSGYIKKIGETFARHGIVIDLISTSEVSVSLTADKMPKKMDGLLAELEEIGRIETEKNISIINVVGTEMIQSQGIIGGIMDALSKAGIQIKMISMGNGRMNLNLVLDDKDSEQAVRIIHALRKNK